MNASKNRQNESNPMKKIITLVSLAAVAGGVLLSGCSKPKKPATPAGDSDASSATAVAAAADGPVDMKIKWAAGKTFAMRMEMNMDTEMKLPDQPDPVKQNIKMMQNFNLGALKKLDNGGWELQLEFENESLNVLMGGRSVMTFDSNENSAQETNNPAAAILRAMIGARLQYFTDASGKVEKMGGLDELMKRISAVATQQQRGMFQQMFSEDTLKRYGSFSEALPNRIVNVGESWSHKDDIVSTIGTLSMDMNYTFKNWEQHGDRKCAHVETAGTIATKTVSAANVGAAVEVQNGKITGDFWFDPELGMIVDVHNTQDMTLKITTRNQNLTQQLSQKIRLSLVDVQ
jgi:outer membrane murein-binding lipoprotein Lpp